MQAGFEGAGQDGDGDADVQVVTPLVLLRVAVGCCLAPLHPSGVYCLQALIACHY